MKSQLLQDFCEFIESEPGHGAKGRQVYLATDEDICGMCKAYKGRKQIVIWVKSCQKPLEKKQTINAGVKVLQMRLSQHVQLKHREPVVLKLATHHNQAAQSMTTT